MDKLQRILKAWLKGENPLLSGVGPSLLGYLVHLLIKDLPRPPLVVTPEDQGEDMAIHLDAFTPTVFIPSWDSDPSSGVPPSSPVIRRRMKGLYRILEEEPTVVTTLRGLAQRIMDPEEFVEGILILVKGMSVDREELAQTLVKLGYTRVDQVEEEGGFSLRGYVVDIFPVNSPHPIRIELWGDEVESIRTFDPISQTSLSPLSKALILPAREMIGEKRVSFTSLMEGRPLILIQPEEVEMEMENLLLEEEDFSPPQEIQAFMREAPLLRVNSLYQEGISLPVESYPLALSRLKGSSRLTQGMEWIRARLAQGIRVYLSHLPGEKERMKTLLAEYDLTATALDGFHEREIPGLYLFPSQLSRGFFWPERGLAIITRQELLGARKRRKKARPRRKGDVLTTLKELSPGDYVVHLEQGIGRYTGLKTLEVEGIQQEFMAIEYAGGDQLLVPVTRLNLVQKYRGAQATPPALDRLGGATWKKTQARVKKAIQDYAQELLRLEAERRLAPGYAFSPDGPDQREFEEEFPFEDTPDQEKATREIKEDMEAPHPMDRLLCGDVGYGKTEVAMRAAFKAVLDGKQVALLVPTTILAEQHYETFRERFKNHPVNIEVLSRFRTPKEQRDILERLARGEVDIIIGTHRLLSRDVVFQDLGLVIIDEEHRFGVRQKDKMKKLKKGVDVLYLSATPIPRTLHLALSGVRQMSIMETPPRGRKPVKTYISRWSPSILKRAIMRELKRGGRVFVVQPRVEGLEELTSQVKALVPQARVAMAHGQMKERELEEVMYRFMKGKIDVLVSTPIVESGLDVPMANTLVVKDAHHLGLSQLYQLRGRVGREREMGYAYFLIPGREGLTPEGEKRLQALREFAQLGSGLKLALRDMEIRGVGNLLGTQQWGHVSQVGFTLYCQMLEETIQRLQGQEVKEEEEPQLELALEALLPQDYVGNEKVKISLYKRIAQAHSQEELAELEGEVRDRFGPLPPAAKNLFALARIKLLVKELGGEKLVKSPRGIFLHLSSSTPLTWEVLAPWVKRKKAKLQGEFLVKLLPPSHDPQDLENLLKELRKSVSLGETSEKEGVKV